MIDVVIAREHAVGEFRVVELLVGLVGADPALVIRELIDDVTRVEEVLEVHLLAHAQQIVVNRELMLVDLRIIVVVLGVGLPRERVVVVRTRGVVGVFANLFTRAIREVRTGVSNTLLDESLDLAIHIVVLERDDRFELCLARLAIREERLDFFPAVLLGVPHEQAHALSLVGGTGPAHANLRVFACALGHGGRELVEGECRTRSRRLAGLDCIALAVCLIGVVDASRAARERAFAQRGRVALAERHREVVLARVSRGRRERIVHAHVQARAIRRIKGGRRLLDGRRERDRLFRLVTELVRRDDRQRVRSRRKGKRGELRAGFDLLAVEGRGRARNAGAGVGRLEVHRELTALLGAILNRGRDRRGGVVDDNGRLNSVAGSILTENLVFAVSDLGGVPLVGVRGERIARDREPRVENLDLPLRIAHVNDLGGIADRDRCAFRARVVGRAQGAPVRKDEACVAGVEVVVVFVRVDTGLCLGARRDVHLKLFAFRDVLVRNRGRNSDPVFVEPLVKDREDLVLHKHTVAEERIGLRRVDGEDWLFLERGDIRVDLGPVNGKRASVVFVVARNREAGRAAHVLLLGDVEADRALLRSFDRNASQRNSGDVGAVGGRHRVLEVLLPREVCLGNREGERAILVCEEVLDHRLIVGVRLEGDGEATNLNVIGRLDRDLGVLCRVEGLCGLIRQGWLFGVLVELDEFRGNLRGSRLSRRRFRDLSDLAHLEVLGIYPVVNALIRLGVIATVLVVEDAAYGVARAGLNLHTAKRAVGHAAHVGLDNGEGVRVNTVVLGEVFDGLVIVVAVLDPHDQRAAGLDDLIGRLHGPHNLVAHFTARTGVLIGDLVVSEADRLGSRVVDFNEFVAVALAGVGGIGNELGNEELADGRIGRRAGDVFGGGGLSRLLGLRLCTAVLELLRVDLACGGSSRTFENLETLYARIGRGAELCGLVLSDRVFRVERARDFGSV